MTKRKAFKTTGFVKVALIENPIEAQVLSGALAQEGIPHELKSYHDTAYDGLFQAHKGWGEIRAPEAFRKKILEFLDDIRREDLSDFEAPPA
ncbi:hypothetical protein [Desulfococcus sp.]|uniref:hypothetical protein n=1 Tax=Desulfococcus sp. TaxID=2025834 RepID=UPI003594668A